MKNRQFIRKQKTFRYIPEYHGPIKTPEGIGQQFTLIRDENGEISRTMQSHLADSPFTRDQIRKCVEDLLNWIWENGIVVTDLRRKNILIQQSSEGPKAWLIDGLGDHVAIRILNVFQKERRRKVERRSSHFLKVLEREHDLRLKVDFLPKNS